MNPIAAILIAVVALAIIALAVYALRSVSQSASQQAQPAEAPPTRLMPNVQDFHVKGETANVVFAVPLGDEEAGEHLTELLSASAIEYVRSKVADGFPLEGVHRIDVSALRNGTPALLTTVELPSIGELPDEAPILRRDPSAHDPIEAVAAVTADRSVAAPSQRGDSLESIPELIELSAPTEAHLRASGVDTTSMGLEDLVLGLFRVSGYQVDAGRHGFVPFSSGQPADTYTVTKAGKRTLVVLVPHQAGGYPELDEQVLSEFAVGVAQASPERALLITDMFGPYAMYERERRDKRTVFITRERLQGFVDSFGIG